MFQGLPTTFTRHLPPVIGLCLLQGVSEEIHHPSRLLAHTSEISITSALCSSSRTKNEISKSVHSPQLFS